MLTILQKEFSSFFNSLVAYVVIGVFLVLLGV
ncbi:MAG: gliding motility-associated ABC transporter permease subunit GldF, partial [Hymenobacteraceae bacterium]|nr:gliding motility-associated ABC transporter permease subunit GldF [Hymenobacteraceae bacterium]